MKMTMGAAALALGMAVLPVAASDYPTTRMEARWNNISCAALTIGFDENDLGYFSISVTGYTGCRGFEGQMCLYDGNGAFLKSWAISDFDSPFGQERTYQCEKGKSYTVKFQGYAYGTGSYDDIILSVSDTCN